MKVRIICGLLAIAVAGALSASTAVVAGALVGDPGFVLTNLRANAVSEAAGEVSVLVEWDTPAYPTAATSNRPGGVRFQRCIAATCAGHWKGVTQVPPASDANPQVATTCPSNAPTCTFRVQPYYFKPYCRYWKVVDTWDVSVGERIANKTCGAWGNRLVLGAWSTTSVTPWPATFV